MDRSLKTEGLSSLIIIFGIIAFFIGLIFGKFSNLTLTKMDELIIDGVVTFVVGGAIFNFFNMVVSKEINEQVRTKLAQEEVNKINTRCNQSFGSYKKKMNALEEYISTEEIPNHVRKKLLDLATKARNSIESCSSELQASIDITSYLDLEDVRQDLLQKACNAASRITPPRAWNQFRESFKRDIYQCLIWTRDSIDHLKDASFDPNLHCHTFLHYEKTKGLNINLYETALNTVRDELCTFSPDGKRLIDTAINNLQDKIRANAKARVNSGGSHESNLKKVIHFIRQKIE
jgi:uncharacterized protein (UPF0147 family)